VHHLRDAFFAFLYLENSMPPPPMPTPSLDPIDTFTYLTSLTVSLGMLYSLLFL